MTPAVGRLRERLERLCASEMDARVLRLQVLEAIAGVIPFDAYAWVLTDPETEVGSAPLADVPSVAELPRLIRLRYLTAVNRWTTLTDTSVAVLSATTGGELSRSLVWRDLLSRYDVSDVASMVFRDRHGCWAFLELWRSAGRTFDEAESAVLADLVPPVTAALRRAQARTFTFAARSRNPPSAGPLVLLLTSDLEVVRSTPGTRDPLRLLVPRDDDLPPVPAGAYNVAAQLLAVEAGVDTHPPTARVHLADGLWLTLRAARLGDDRPRPEPDIAVTIEEATPAERVSLFVRCSALSQREHELLELLVAGGDTREIAQRMYLSVHTVQDHLKSVFAKTGTRSRRALLARVLGS